MQQLINLTDTELLNTVGGGISASLISAAVRAFTTIIEVGKMIGTSLRRGINKNYC